MNRKTLLALAVLTALSAGTAFAVTPVTTPTPAQAPTAARVQMDANGDGVIDRAEAAKYPRLAENFDAVDKNRDGKLGKDEMPPRPDRGPRKGGEHARGDHAGERMAQFDTNKDGRLSRAEATAGGGKLANRFDELDANKDGFIDKADHEARARQRTDQWFAATDTDKDGKLSRAEVDAAKTSRHAADGKRLPPPPAR